MELGECKDWNWSWSFLLASYMHLREVLVELSGDALMVAVELVSFVGGLQIVGGRDAYENGRDIMRGNL